MRADFVNEVAGILDIKRKDLIEKDLLLHQILLDLSGDRFFTANVLFKGGTCLIKSYFGYLRFSEDIDFTWKDQGVFEGMSQKAIRAYLSRVIDNICEIFEEIALLHSGKIFDWGKERDLLLSEIDETDFYSFLSEFQVFLKKIIKNIG